MKIYDTEANSYTIEVPEGNGEYPSTCPKCSHTRKKKTDKCLNWNRDKNAGYCHHCDTRFTILTKKKVYVKPEWINNTELTDKTVKWFESRGIKQFTLRSMQISEGVEWMPQENKEMNTIQFNFFRDGELINIKYRDGKKNFKLFKDAELIFYNLDSIKDTEEVIIVEGEMDALSLYECGFHHVVSVPNGANNKLEYLDNCIDYFENKKKIILATDNDIPGVDLRTTLAHRIGIEKCYKVSFKDKKDANEYLIAYGKDELIKVINEAEAFPVEGVVRVDHLRDELRVLLKEGLKPGLQIEVPEFDELISFEKNRLYTVTGIPGHGKSEFLDYMLCKLNVLHGWKVGYFSPENFPVQLHISKIIEKISGCKFIESEMDEDLYEYTLDYINDNFFFVRPDDNYKISTVLEKAKYLVHREGINAFVIDPYNKLEHQFRSGQNETSYVSEFLDTIINFAHRQNIAVFLVAHPRKMNKRENGSYEIPTLYDISGSANFYNKTDYGITVYRTTEQSEDGVNYSNRIEAHIQKVKFKHLGKTGMCRFAYDGGNGRFTHWDGADINNVYYEKNPWIINAKMKNDDITQTLTDIPF